MNVPAAPRVSVIVPTYRDSGPLAACLSSLAACLRSMATQGLGVDVEIIVSASADHPDQLPDFPADGSVRYLAAVPRRFPGTARNAALEVATGDILLFTDADAVVPSTWLADFLAAWDGRSALAGAIRNGRPESATATADYLCEFLDFTPGTAAGPAWHGVTCNLLVPRPLWEKFGPFPDVKGGEDTAFTCRLADAGLLRFSPTVWVEHRGRAGMRTVLTHQYHLGAAQARLPGLGRHPWRFVLEHPVLAPGAVLGRLGLTAVRVPRRAPLGARRAALVAPMVVACLTAWGAGLATEGLRIRRSRKPERRGQRSSPAEAGR